MNQVLTKFVEGAKRAQSTIKTVQSTATAISPVSLPSFGEKSNRGVSSKKRTTVIYEFASTKYSEAKEFARSAVKKFQQRKMNDLDKALEEDFNNFKPEELGITTPAQEKADHAKPDHDIGNLDDVFEMTDKEPEQQTAVQAQPQPEMKTQVKSKPVNKNTAKTSKPAVELENSQEEFINNHFTNPQAIKEMVTAENQYEVFKKVMSKSNPNFDIKKVSKETWAILDSLKGGEKANEQAAKSQILYKMMEEQPQAFGELVPQQEKSEPKLNIAEEIDLSDTPLPDQLGTEKVKNNQVEPQEESKYLTRESIESLASGLNYENTQEQSQKAKNVDSKLEEPLPLEAIQKAYRIEEIKAAREEREADHSFFLTNEELAALPPEFKKEVKERIEQKVSEENAKRLTKEIFQDLATEKEADYSHIPEIEENQISDPRLDPTQRVNKNAEIIKSADEIEKEKIIEVVNHYYETKDDLQKIREKEHADAKLHPTEHSELYNQAFQNPEVVRGQIKVWMKEKQLGTLQKDIENNVTEIYMNGPARYAEQEGFDPKEYAEEMVELGKSAGKKEMIRRLVADGHVLNFKRKQEPEAEQAFNEIIGHHPEIETLDVHSKGKNIVDQDGLPLLQDIDDIITDEHEQPQPATVTPIQKRENPAPEKDWGLDQQSLSAMR